jgi:N-succinyldiaminopimelate aminotransferase
MNPDLKLLQPYPFEKLRQLLEPLQPPSGLEPISLGIGEPQHASPEFVLRLLKEKLPLLAKYPSTRGIPELRNAAANWLQQRFQLASVDPDSQVLPVAGTREALFAIAQTVVDRRTDPLVLCPNPFYQIYEGAALLAGAQPLFLDCRVENGFLPDFEAVSTDSWQRCQLLYICTPGNPTGAVMGLAQLVRLVELAQQHDFVIASDECYSEIYADEDNPPPGLLQACQQAGVGDYHNCIVFHSLSKRSNLPGLRSGFVAGDANIMQRFLMYRTYQGCALPLQHQWASAAAWSDEDHVRENRAQYREKFTAVLDTLGDVLSVEQPQAGFYLWPQTPVPDTDFAAGLYQQQHLTVLPGRFLGRDGAAGNPGENHVRMALVASVEKCVEAAQRVRNYCESL